MIYLNCAVNNFVTWLINNVINWLITYIYIHKTCFYFN